MSPPMSGDLNPVAAIVVVAAAIAVVSLSEVESCRCVLMTQIRFVAVPIVMVAAQRSTEVFSCLPLNQLAMISFPFLARSLFAPDGSSHHTAKFNDADLLWQALACGGGYLKTCGSYADDSATCNAHTRNEAKENGRMVEVDRGMDDKKKA